MTRTLTVAFLLLGLVLGCGGGSSSPAPLPTGTLSLRLGSDSFPGYDQVVVSVEKVEGSRDGSTWIALGDVKATFDLMALQNGHSALILPALRMTTGTFAQFRLTWATVNYQDQTRQPAFVQRAGATSGLLLTMPATTTISGPVSIGTATDTVAQIMLSGQQAVQERAGTQPYRFQATGRAYDLASSARITGRLSDGNGMPFAEVLAETVDGLGLATLQRRAFTDISGNYSLEALPMGSLYFVVAQPASLTTAWAARAADPVNATTPTTFSRDLAFSSPQAPGLLTLVVNPPSALTEGTWGELRQTLATGASGSATLIVRSETASTGAVQDQVSFLGLAPGLYGITAQRSVAGATPSMKVGAQVAVSAGATATASLSYP